MAIQSLAVGLSDTRASFLTDIELRLIQDRILKLLSLLICDLAAYFKETDFRRKGILSVKVS